jgi:hypothetical protein
LILLLGLLSIGLYWDLEGDMLISLFNLPEKLFEAESWGDRSRKLNPLLIEFLDTPLPQHFFFEASLNDKELPLRSTQSFPYLLDDGFPFLLTHVGKLTLNSLVDFLLKH